MQDIYCNILQTFIMENAEEVMQLLEEFSKVKPKEIPRELEDYLGYVAKTGDPVFQWSLIRGLLREKLLSVVTDFYESTLTAELPPCPNVEPFNYERMKTSLLERFDAFSGAPFTIQRICELLINPRKEYNRADKYMRAIEKNILVVSTREPGTGKRPLECDQSETVLNGMPDVKLVESDGGLLHVPTDLPYLGAPPASNDVTIETTEPSSAVEDRVGPAINGDVDSSKANSEKSWDSQESDSSPVVEDAEPVSSRVELKNEDVPVMTEDKNMPTEDNDCDSNNRLSIVADSINQSSNIELDNKTSIKLISETSDTLPDSIDSSDSIQERSETLPTLKLESDEVGSLSDENEVSSSPAAPPADTTNIKEDINEPTGSEAVATDSDIIQENEPEENLSPDSENNSTVLEDVTQTISISEVTATKSDDVDLECNEITGTVISPISPGNTTAQQTDDVAEHKVNVELVEETSSHPDSSDDTCLQNKPLLNEESQKCESNLSSEADSLSEVNVGISESSKSSDSTNLAPDQTEEIVIQEVTEELSPSKFAVEDCIEKPIEEPQSVSPDPTEEATVSASSCSTSLKENIPTTETQTDVQSTSDIAEEMYDNERRDESVIQSTPNISPDSQDQITIEEISVDPTCEAEEEAMDVDDCSNQMMVSEGENEGEPMDEGDQLQS